jgi:uncharacterized protein (TIGR03083 family)
VQKTPEFTDLLRLIDERSTAFGAAVAAAPGLGIQVPTCPEWTLFDLVRHLGEGRRKWAAIVAAGPADAPPARSVWDTPAAPRDREALLDWWTASARQLLDALRRYGPDRGCWTWWGTSQSPQTAGAAARHQLYEIALHTYDAQPTCCATTARWPHEPAVVDYHATEGRSWRLWLSADGARTAPLPAPAPTPDASLTGPAGELLLVLYGRIPVAALKADGDRRVFDRLLAWDPEE